MVDFETDINKITNSPEKNSLSAFEQQGRRKGGEKFFQLYFRLHALSQSKLPETRITTFNQLSRAVGLSRKVTADYIYTMGGLNVFVISTGHGKGNRRENKIVVKPKKEWSQKQIDEVVSIYNWNKEKWT